MLNLQRIRAIAIKEIRQLRRDRLTFGMIVGIPLAQMLMFGYALNTDVRHLRAAVADQSNSFMSRSLISDVQASQVLDVHYRVTNAKELEHLLRRGKVNIAIFIPRDYDRRLREHKRAAAQLLVDGSDPVIMGAARQLANMITTDRYRSTRQALAPVFEIRAYYNPEGRTAVNVVPGLIGVILTMTMVLFTSIAIVRERERGNMELLISTPVTRFELMTGKILPYIVIGIIQITIILLLGVYLFHVPIRGTISNIYIVSTLFVAANLALGLLISTAARTQFQAVQMMIFIFLPSVLMSGFAFTFEGMPRLAQQIAEVLPLTHFVRIIRGIVLRGATLTELSFEIGVLVIFTAVTLSIAILRFRKRLD